MLVGMEENINYICATARHFTYGGKPIRLRGVGIGNWLNLEHFMIGLPTSDQMIQSAFEKIYGLEVKEEILKRYRERVIYS